MRGKAQPSQECRATLGRGLGPQHPHRVRLAAWSLWRVFGISDDPQSFGQPHGQIFVASLRNVRWPPKFQPNFTEMCNGSVNPSESLQIYTTIIEAVGGDDRVKANLFPMALQGQVQGTLMDMPPASVYSWEDSCS
uniref:Retrotransposon protein, putative, unclassified n=2 Tax=Oryza sativa subsp. japonica TaxID=39947 RepID=Q7G348_ORYSJ|nr:Hypothetical protein similar to putative retroelements [Oryza sativa Japonica Group]AAP53446.1 retrotransposon protein, putative, unclassified [Oryza sativa Japonica Group]